MAAIPSLRKAQPQPTRGCACAAVRRTCCGGGASGGLNGGFGRRGMLPPARPQRRLGAILAPSSGLASLLGTSAMTRKSRVKRLLTRLVAQTAWPDAFLAYNPFNSRTAAEALRSNEVYLPRMQQR